MFSKPASTRHNPSLKKKIAALNRFLQITSRISITYLKLLTFPLPRNNWGLEFKKKRNLLINYVTVKTFEYIVHSVIISVKEAYSNLNRANSILMVQLLELVVLEIGNSLVFV